MDSHLDKYDNVGLRNFAFITGTIVVVVFGLIIPWLLNNDFPKWPWWIAVLLLIPALIRPKLLYPIYVAWVKVGLYLGWINSRIILSVIFYLLIFPTGIVLSLFGKDPMYRKLEAEAKSYRVFKKKREKKDLERLF